MVQRPGRAAAGEVVRGLRGQVPVHARQGGGDDVGRDRVRPQRREHQPREHDHRHDRRERLGHQALDAAGVEAEQGEAAGAVELPHQHPRDEEARDDEEDVHADIAPARRADARVGEQDQCDGQRAQALDVPPERRGPARVSCGAAASGRDVLVRRPCRGACAAHGTPSREAPGRVRRASRHARARGTPQRVEPVNLAAGSAPSRPQGMTYIGLGSLKRRSAKPPRRSLRWSPTLARMRCPSRVMARRARRL